MTIGHSSQWAVLTWWPGAESLHIHDSLTPHLHPLNKTKKEKLLNAQKLQQHKVKVTWLCLISFHNITFSHTQSTEKGT